MNLYLRILKFIRPYLGRLIAAGFCTVMTAAANLLCAVDCPRCH